MACGLRRAGKAAAAMTLLFPPAACREPQAIPCHDPRMPNRYRIAPRSSVSLKHFDPDDTSLVDGGKEEGREKLEKLSGKLDALQELLYAEHRHKVLIVLQGM